MILNLFGQNEHCMIILRSIISVKLRNMVLLREIAILLQQWFHFTLKITPTLTRLGIFRM